MFLQAHKEVDLAPHLVIGLVFKVGDGDQFPLALRLENLDPFFRVSRVHVSQPYWRMGA